MFSKQQQNVRTDHMGSNTATANSEDDVVKKATEQVEMPILETMFGGDKGFKKFLSALKVVKELAGGDIFGQQGHSDKQHSGKRGANTTASGSHGGALEAQAMASGPGGGGPQEVQDTVMSHSYNQNTTGSYLVNTLPMPNADGIGENRFLQIIEHQTLNLTIPANQSIGRGVFRFRIGDLIDPETAFNFRIWQSYKLVNLKMMLTPREFVVASNPPNEVNTRVMMRVAPWDRETSDEAAHEPRISAFRGCCARWIQFVTSAATNNPADEAWDTEWCVFIVTYCMIIIILHRFNRVYTIVE